MKDLNTGNVQLQELPKFEARRVLKDGSLETRGQIRGLEGDVANFSYCQVANAFKEVCHIALRLLVDSPVSSADFSGVSVPFDLLNLIIKKNYKFRLVTYKSVSGGLSSDSKGSIKVNREYRVNGDSDIFFIFGSESDISDILERGIVHSAYTGEGFHLSSHNLYADVPEGEEVCGLVFRTDSPGDIETADMAFWEDGVLVDSWEILSEDQIVDLFGV
jgi:hypothetical protein